MKTCALCLRPSPSDVATCPYDGEATWMGEIARANVAAHADDEAMPPILDPAADMGDDDAGDDDGQAKRRKARKAKP